ncbi:hypothetical protein MTR_1g117030 [Medicago truncatula]|uniref:Uncharacterized protein n=1 Tax=Medicago truncatula TaxID=3880 RepID=A0A072VS91_MEDTR|nr:hypothetical protein MTR_1g117030 [Medicago truncatula]
MNEADGVCDDEEMSGDGSDDYMGSSEDEAAGVRLDDSEEEKAMGMNDGFLVEDDETPPIVGNAVVDKFEVDKIVTRKGGLNCDPLKLNLSLKSYSQVENFEWLS